MNRSFSTSHLSDEDLIRRLYGIGEEDDHLAACSECSDRWLAIQNIIRSARAEQPRAPEMTGRKLAVQRQQILARVNQPVPGSLVWRWIPPAAAAASLLAAALFLSHLTGPVTPPPAAAAAVNTEADAQLFTDVYSMEQDVEPRAAAPIRGLFQEASFESAQESPKQ